MSQLSGIPRSDLPPLPEGWDRFLPFSGGEDWEGNPILRDKNNNYIPLDEQDYIFLAALINACYKSSP
jgi:hypothetical protein